MNGKSLVSSTRDPFALSLSKGERYVCQYPPMVNCFPVTFHLSPVALSSAHRALSYPQVLPFRHTAQAALVSRNRATCSRARGLRASFKLVPSIASGSFTSTGQGKYLPSE